MKCTVLGGKGFIGRALAEKLSADGHEVWVPDRFDESVYHTPLGEVFYCIGLTAGFRDRPYDAVTAHVELLSQILREAEYESLLYMSSTRVYSRSTKTCEQIELPVLSACNDDLYNISKLMGESLCLSLPNSGVKVARLSNVVGPRMSMDSLVGQLIEEALQGRVKLQTHPDSEKDYIYIDDAVETLMSISFHGQERLYNVASGHQTSHRYWGTALANHTKCKFEYKTDAPYQSFPPINVDRLKSEFRYIPAGKAETVSKTLLKIESLEATSD